MSYEIGGNFVGVNAQAIIADYQIVLALGEDLNKLLSLISHGFQENWDVGHELGQKKPGRAVRCRIVLKKDEVAFGTLPLQ